MFRSNNHIYAQLIDDSSSETIVCGSSIEKEFRAMKGLPREIAFKVGEKVVLPNTETKAEKTKDTEVELKTEQQTSDKK